MTHIIGQEKPSLTELQHHGVKGMKWGVRRDRPSSGDSSSKPGMSTKKKVAIGATAAVVIGGASAAYILSRRGKTPAAAVSAVKFATKNKHGTSKYGEEAVKAFEQHVWSKNVKEMMSPERQAAHKHYLEVSREAKRLGMHMLYNNETGKYFLTPLHAGGANS